MLTHTFLANNPTSSYHTPVMKESDPAGQIHRTGWLFPVYSLVISAEINGSLVEVEVSCRSKGRLKNRRTTVIALLESEISAEVELHPSTKSTYRQNASETKRLLNEEGVHVRRI